MTFSVSYAYCFRVARRVSIILGLSGVFALSAQIAVPLCTPVPVTLQTLAVLLCGQLCGWYAVSGFCAYLLEGCVGLPVFARGGCGVLYLAGPTSGYLFGMLGALIIIACLRHTICSPLRTALVLGGAHIGITVVGVGYLSFLTSSVATACAIGLYPFVVGEGIKFAISLVSLRVVAWYRT